MTWIKVGAGAPCHDHCRHPLHQGRVMILQPSYGHGRRASADARPYPRGGGRRPIAGALRVASRLVLGIPTALAALVLGIAMFGLGLGLGVVVGFMVFSRAWPLP